MEDEEQSKCSKNFSILYADYLPVTFVQYGARWT